VQNYLQLRVIDEQKRLLEATVAAYQRSLKMTENQYRAGVAGRTRWQAQTQLKSTQADLIDLIWQRAQFENAIAVLMGKAPAEFSLAESKTSRHCRSPCGCRRSCWSGARTSPPPSVR
jgi:outer membrane protein TolC